MRDVARLHVVLPAERPTAEPLLVVANEGVLGE
jgi:hypothetical protein